MDKIKNIAIKAAVTAGKILKDGYGTTFNINHKGSKNNLVTEYDHLSEKTIIDIISSEYPSHSFLAEESGKTSHYDDAEVKWVIDPLDGTVNFAHSVPIFSVSIAAVVNGELACGVVYNPMLDELFYAVKGQGAYFNNKRMYVSESKELKTSLLVTGFPYQLGKHKFDAPQIFMKLVRGGIPVRRLGSAALDLVYVAAGRFDGFWEIFLKPWDVAAGVLIIREAGGKVTQYNGQEFSIYDNSLIATNGLIHDSLTQTINEQIDKYNET